MTLQRKSALALSISIAVTVIFLLFALEIFLSGRAQLITASGGMRFVSGLPAVLMGLCSMCAAAAAACHAAKIIWLVREIQFELMRNVFVLISAAFLLWATALTVARQFGL